MEYLLTCATTDREGIAALAAMDAALIEEGEGKALISFVETLRCDSSFAVPLAVVLARVEDRKSSFEFGGVPKIAQDLFFRNWFFRFLGISVQPASTPSSCLPFEHFETVEIDRFFDYLDQYLEGKGLPPADSTFTQQLQQILGEVFVNAETHSESALGVFVCGQHYPAEQRLCLTIADGGITVPVRVAKRFGKHLNPVHALQWAMKKGHTTKEQTPGGVGLKLVRDFVHEHHGAVWIATGQAFWSLAAGEESFSSLPDPFPGTVVHLTMPTEPTTGAPPPEFANKTA
jgi:signal transduction histidine kinase